MSFIEYVILGFLMLRKLTQYDILNALQQKVSPFFSASLGSIQAALKKLETKKYVELYETVENGRKKKIYSITEAGKQHFMEWMLSSLTPNRLKTDATTRLFFLGFMSKSDRLAICKLVIGEFENTLKEFEAAYTKEKQKTNPDKLEDIVKFQLKTLDLGIYYHNQILNWFKELYYEMEAELNGEKL